MRSRALTFAWEFWWRMPATTIPVAGTLGIVVLILYSASAYGIPDFTHESGQTLRQVLHFTLFLTCVIGCQAAPLAGQMKLVSYYTLPIATWKLIGWKMLYGAIAAAASYLALAVTLNVKFGAEWPLLGQALFVVVWVMWGQALTWSLHRSQLVAIIARMTAVLLLGGWIASRYMSGPLLATELTTWDTVTTGELISLVAMAVAAYAYCLFGVSRDRHGSTPDFHSASEAIEKLFNRFSSGERKFRSRQRALFWYEWRQKSFLIPATMSMAVIVIAVLSWSTDMANAVKLCTGMSVLGMLYCAGVGMFVGSNHDDLKLRSFYTTRPATDIEMANSVLKTMSWSIVVAWMIWCVGLALVASRFVLAGRAGELVQQIEKAALGGADIWWIWVYLVGCLLVSWSAAGLGASLCLSRVSLLNSATYTLIGVWLTWCAVKFIWLPQDWHKPFLDLSLGALGTAFTIGTLIANVAALRNRLIRWPWIAGGVTACAILLTVVCALYSNANYTVGIVIFAIGICCLPAAPFATAPLAVSWNRHR